MTAVLTLLLYSLPQPTETVDFQPFPSQPSHSEPKSSSTPHPPGHPCSETVTVDTKLTPPSQVGCPLSRPLCSTLPMPNENEVIPWWGPGDWSHRHGHTPAALIVSSQAHGRASPQLGRVPPPTSPLPFCFLGGRWQTSPPGQAKPPRQQLLYIDEGAEPRQARCSPPIRL